MPETTAQDNTAIPETAADRPEARWLVTAASLKLPALLPRAVPIAAARAGDAVSCWLRPGRIPAPLEAFELMTGRMDLVMKNIADQREPLEAATPGSAARDRHGEPAAERDGALWRRAGGDLIQDAAVAQTAASQSLLGLQKTSRAPKARGVV